MNNNLCFDGNYNAKKLLELYRDGEYRRVISIGKNKLATTQANNASYHDIVGCAYLHLGEFENAIEYLKVATSLKPSHEPYFEHLLVASKQARCVADVLEWSLKLIDLSVSEGAFLIVFSELEETAAFNIMLRFLEKSCYTEFKNVASFLCAGLVFFKEDMIPEAISVHELANVNFPQEVENLHRLMACYHVSGETEKALKIAMKILEIDPEHASTHRIMSTMNKSSLSDHHFSSLMNAFENNSDRNKIQSAFALGQIANKLGDYEASFRFYEYGNKNEFKIRAKDLGSEIYLIKNTIEFFNNGLRSDQNRIEVTNNEFQNVFIVGMPRSGTTLVEQILSSHSLVGGLGELDDLRRIVARKMFENKLLFPTFAQTTASITGEYLLKLKDRRNNEKILIDKMPGNYATVGYILWSNPKAKVVNMQRDPMAVAWSIYTKYFPAEDLAWTFDLSEIYNSYCLYIKMMNFWNAIFPDRIFNLKYETLTENQVEVTHELLDFCELNFEQSCLNFHKNKRVVKTASRAQVSQKMYKGSSNSWRAYENFLGEWPDKFNGLNKMTNQ